MIRHRGPDDMGLLLVGDDEFCAAQKGLAAESDRLNRFDHRVALGHVRFSIVDLTDAGHQPFVTEDQQVCLAFNGEIYNYVEVRQELEGRGYSFLTQSDTEVLAKAYQCWGVECFERFVGFWALALYDRRLKKLLLARDRIGKAPLYFCRSGGRVYWASEIKSILQLLPEQRGDIREEAIVHFANWFKKDFGDTTFFKNIDTFPKASFAWVQEDGSFEVHRYWDLPRQRLQESQLFVDDAVDEFRSIMSDAVRIRHRADAPVAVQLSGGLDSSTLVANAVDFSDEVNVYTIKYGYGEQDEEPYARAVADQYGDKVNYHIVRPSEDDFVDQLPAYSALMGEPYHSPNQLSNHHIWKEMAGHGLRVVLYGAGGDEVFSGYASEYYPPYLKTLLRQGRARTFLHEFLSCSEYDEHNPMKDYIVMLAKLVPGMPRKSIFGNLRFIPKRLNPLSDDLIELPRRIPTEDLNERLLNNMEDWRMNYWLRIDNQNSMGVPVELRSPFLDHRLLDFAFRLPPSYMIRDGWMKWIVRAAMKDKLPDNVLWRRTKMGFPFPLKEWLLKNKQSLSAEIADLDCPYVDSQTMLKGWDELSTDYSDYMWGMLSVLLWWKYSVIH